MKHSMYSTILTICICLFLCQTTFTYAGTWRDDFEDNKTTEWEIFNLVRQHEKWWVSDGVAVGEIFEHPFLSLWRTGEQDWEFYTVSCRAKLVVDKTSPPSIGLTLHDRGEEDSRYLFLINFETGIVTIHKAVPGGGYVNNEITVEKDTWYDLSASVYEDGVLEFKVNDTVVVKGIDLAPLKGGFAGLVVQNAEAYFDNVQITGENIRNGGPAKTFAVEAQQKLTTTWGNIKRNGDL